MNTTTLPHSPQFIETQLQSWLLEQLASRLEVQPETLDPDQPLSQLGLDSATAVSLAGDLETLTGLSLSATLAWEFPTLRKLIEFIAAQMVHGPQASPPIPVRSSAVEAIAIIGMGCRFPGAKDIESFWNLLENGVNAVTEVPMERWDAEALYHPNPGTPGKMNTRWGGFLQDVDQFDPAFFGITPREACLMDPQQRLLLEVAWEALENSGIPASRTAGSSTGVFIGISNVDYSRVEVSRKTYEAYIGTGNSNSIAANRLSYIFDWHGPSIAMDTACSSAVVALHQAAVSLRNRECDMALAGGVNLVLTPDVTLVFSQAHMMSSDGRCKTFDASADGYVRGEGVGIVVLKRLGDAQRDGDEILAVIKGSAVNQDGRSNGITAPNGQAQQTVIRLALEAAGVSPDRISYIETHGTGTPLGDPIEVRALGEVYGTNRPPDHPCYLSSVKTNIGHLESAAGIAGLIKAVLAFRHRALPAHLHLVNLNPHLNLEKYAFRIPQTTTPWEGMQGSRWAALSSFGFGGTNAHLILGEGYEKPRAQASIDRPVHLLTLSAKSEIALQALVLRWKEFLEKLSSEEIADLAFSANTGRDAMPHRLVIPAKNKSELTQKLIEYGEKPSAPPAPGKIQAAALPRVAFLLTGQGSQSVGMGKQLYETQPGFRANLERCAEILRPHLERPLLDVLFGRNDAGELLHQTAYTQPALFALDWALAELWRSWGVGPAALLGHSLGEYVAACLAGVASLEEMLPLVARRAQLMQSLPKTGKMAAVIASAERLEPLLGPYVADVSIAAVNGPELTVLSGKTEALDEILALLQENQIQTEELKVSHAFHSPLMEPILEEFSAAAQKIRYQTPQLPLVSNRTGEFWAEGEKPSAEYWVRHLREPVQFYRGVRTLTQAGHSLFLEAGPHPVLSGMARRCLEDRSATFLPSLKRGLGEWEVLATSLAECYRRGVPVDWRGWDRDYSRVRRSIPNYPFERKRCWIPEALKPGEKALAAAGYFHSAEDPKKHYWEKILGEDENAFLRDHRIQGDVVFPAAAYVAWVLEAAHQIGGGNPEQFSTLRDLRFHRALFLNGERPVRMQLALTWEESGDSGFQIFSEDPSAHRWVLHASGRVGFVSSEESPGVSGETEDVKAIHSRLTEIILGKQFYQVLAQNGLEYGKNFQGIESLHCLPGEALGRLRSTNGSGGHAPFGSILNPSLLDAGFQALGGALRVPSENGTGSALYLPVGIDGVSVLRRGSHPRYSHATLRSEGEASAEQLVGDIRFLDETGCLVAQAKGLTLQRLTTDHSRRQKFSAGEWFYELNWENKARPPIETTAPSGGYWLIFADPEGLGDELAEELKARGEAVYTVFPGGSYRRLSATSWELPPEDGDALTCLLGELQKFSSDPCRGVIHLWSLRVPGPEGLRDVVVSQNSSSLHVLRWIQASVSEGFSPQLFLVTRGSQAVGNSSQPLALAQAPLWGLGRVIALEHPELRCIRIDLDPTAPEAEAKLLAEELFHQDGEDQIAWRGAERFVLRLKAKPTEGPAEDQPIQERKIANDGSQPFRLEIFKPGLLSSLSLAPADPGPPGAGEVEIEVKASGLNFMDVMNAMGILPSDLVGKIPLGGECAGRVLRVGPGVVEFKPGDSVMGIAPGSFASKVRTSADLLARVPEGWSFEEATTVPITFLTAYFALIHLGRLAKGERILIHAAAGGVGLAAVQIAQWKGAEIFATAGSEVKREYLRSLGIAQVLDSRQMDFSEKILEATSGRGVDLVLNSLAGPYIEKSLEALAPYGRFLEIGKTDIYQNHSLGLKPFRNNLSYFAIDLHKVAYERPPLLKELFEKLSRLFAEGKLQPLPWKGFEMTRATEAFRYMAGRKNIGKIVLTPPSGGELKLKFPLTSPLKVRPDATYWITGGLGGLGLAFAQALAEMGAKHLVLQGRSGPRPEAQGILEKLREAGVQIHVAEADVASWDATAKVWKEIETSMPPLRGVLHAAGVLADELLFRQTPESWGRVLKPKAEGAWNLHQLTKGLELDFFVLFSSIAGVLGSPGQGNYAAANAFLDALAHYRRREGLRALSINWGPWAEVGMAARNAESLQTRSKGGLDWIEPKRGIELFQRATELPQAQLAIFHANWQELGKSFRGRAIPPLLQTWLETSSSKQSSQPSETWNLESLVSQVVERQRDFLLEFLRNKLAQVMGVSADAIDAEQALNSLGIDSLMGLELKGEVEAKLGFNLPMTALLQSPTLSQLADRILELLREKTASSPSLPTGTEEKAQTTAEFH